jgi:hypothetical protein
MKLMTDIELADKFGLPLEKFHDLRKRKHWPCVRLGRFEYRFTEAQVEEIVRLHTQAPAKTHGASVPGAGKGQTARSAARSR